MSSNKIWKVIGISLAVLVICFVVITIIGMNVMNEEEERAMIQERLDNKCYFRSWELKHEYYDYDEFTGTCYFYNAQGDLVNKEIYPELVIE